MLDVWSSCSCNKEGGFNFLPGHGDWCDHWKQCVWFVPGEGMSITKDEELCLHAVHTDISILYNLKNQASRNEIMQCGFKNGDFKLILPPERIAIYGDSEWRHTMFSAISNSVRIKISLSLSLKPPPSPPHTRSSVPKIKIKN